MTQGVMSVSESQKINLFPRANNLEWLRLIFALQVVITHTVSHIAPNFSLPKIITNFPGVPAFFLVSGFLIYSSYLNAPGKQYFENRFLRLFPGLFVVTIGGGVIMATALGFDAVADNDYTFISWFIAQITIGQAYNPQLFRSVGVGVINGSLWTITVEILFYFAVPILVWLDRRFRFSLVLLIIISFVIYAIGPLYLSINFYRDKTYFDLLSLTPIVWGWMFGIGIIAVKYFSLIKNSIKYAPFILGPMLLMALYGDGVFFAASSNRLGLIYFICYGYLIFWASFGCRVIELPFDFSYGAYIWHMPIINSMLIIGLSSFSLALTFTLIASAISWYAVEKPMLKLKRQSLRPI